MSGCKDDIFIYVDIFLLISDLSLPSFFTSHHRSWPAQHHLHQNPRSAGRCPCPSRSHPLGHHWHPFVGHPTGPVTPTNPGSHANPVSNVTAGENAGRSCPAAVTADAPAHQCVRAAAAGTQETLPEISTVAAAITSELHQLSHWTSTAAQMRQHSFQQ